MNNHILKTADRVISGERQKQYGSAEHSFDVISRMWSAYLGTNISPEKVAMMMILLKVGRSTVIPTEDSLVDIAGYAALAWDISDEILFDDD